ncbi:ABC transporter ATP-binding protein [Pseudoruegeria sp. HB172150]|uniref:ABC transporter ATP-binding protein n=1 Tax=Pseudoruegeria sp. HB172150 TaxID=2721164 RepID=UPI0015576C36|nr:ABC transporter ATP-binding protein [Pseudoruegeria sp. HB172150]
MSLLRLSDISVTLRQRTVLERVSLEIGAGELVGLIGANGAGKTTLMRAALGLIPAQGDSSLAQMAPRARAKAAAWLPQAREVSWPVDVETLVTLGRIPHLGTGQPVGEMDRAAAERALDRMGLKELRARTVTRLSGGEQARVLIARVLAQETPLILADEPIAGLDPAHQISTMRIFRELAAEGHSVLVSIHDLGLAARHCTRLVLLGGHAKVADGVPRQVLTPDNLRDHFGICAHFEETAQGPIFQATEVVG